MKRMVIVLFLLLLTYLTGFSQVFTDNSVTTPPKTANEFMEKVHHNVNYQTGALNFSLRLLSLKVDEGLEIPIDLSYSGNGIGFDQQTGEIGVGWGVSSNYKVNRTIYCRPDEHYAKPDEQTLMMLSGSTNHEWRDIQLTQFTIGLPSNGGLTLMTGLQELDAEYDIFDYNTPTVSGTFIIEDAATKAIATSDNLLTKIDYSIDPLTGIKSLLIKDTKGYSYIAGFDAGTNAYLSESIPRYGKQASYSWPITKIVTPNSKSAEVKYVLTDIFEASKGQLGVSITETNGNPEGYPVFGSSFDDEIDASVPNRKSYLTSSIKSQYGEIRLFRLPNSKLIDSVVLYDNKLQAIKRVKFNRGIAHNYIFLESIEIYGDQSQDALVYNFDYYRQDEQMTFSADIWGNIKQSSTSLKRYPAELQNEVYYDVGPGSSFSIIPLDLLTLPGISSVSFMDRSPSGIPSFFSLKQVNLPTGGRISYTYEGNYFREPLSNEIRQGPGIRLSNIEKYDPISGKSLMTSYEYGVNGDGVGSISAPIDKKFFGCDNIIIQLGPDYSTIRSLYGTRARFFSNDVVSDGDPFFTRYNYVTYPVVTEKTALGGRRLYFKAGQNMTWYHNAGQNQSFYSVMRSGQLETEYRPGFVYDYNLAYKPLIEKTETFNQTGEVMKTETYEYSFLGGKTFFQMKIKPYARFRDGNFSPEYNHAYVGFQSIYDYTLSTIRVGTHLVSKQLVTEKRGDNFVTETAEFAYNSDHQLIKETIYLSDQSKKETHYTYANYFSGMTTGDQITEDVLAMKNSNQLDQWIEKRVYAKRNIGGVDNTTILNADFQHNLPGTNKVRTLYSFLNSGGSATFTPVGITGGLLQLDNKYQKQMAEVTKVDNAGNILTQTDQHGVLTTYVWGYKETYPVAKVLGADYNTTIQYLDTSILNTGTESQIRQQLIQLRNGFSGNPSVQVFTYTFKPLVGITSETDSRGISTYYEYDGLRRLSCIRDHNNNIIKTICYNYHGQPEVCSGSGIYAKLTGENITYDGDLVYGDVIVRFYSDAACTIPYSVNNLLIVYSENTYYYLDEFEDSFDISYGCSGYEVNLESNRLLANHDPLMGFVISFYLKPGSGFIPVNAWVDL